ncbi:hypothetical protein [Acinetobacter seifertii]|uniref:Uncharacterized protein n=1 Tax=Acinetobacter seifertii TaxID=1530123 RepID=A0ABX8L9L3_9GAMM|nr:hypothetical protein [Acinetobacter seifertii]QXB47695.1 hypothetical protein I6L30_06760 [Acinetobacter seifertii]
MTDLNKERELCNLSFEKYWDDFCKAYGNGFDRSLAKLFFANAWGEAKAQAVPEGYCLVPKEIPDSVVSCLENSGFHWGDGTRDHYTPIYSLMVEVASESGAEK